MDTNFTNCSLRAFSGRRLHRAALKTRLPTNRIGDLAHRITLEINAEIKCSHPDLACLHLGSGAYRNLRAVHISDNLFRAYVYKIREIWLVSCLIDGCKLIMFAEQTNLNP